MQEWKSKIKLEALTFSICLFDGLVNGGGGGGLYLGGLISGIIFFKKLNNNCKLEIYNIVK